MATLEKVVEVLGIHQIRNSFLRQPAATNRQSVDEVGAAVRTRAAEAWQYYSYKYVELVLSMPSSGAAWLCHFNVELGNALRSYFGLGGHTSCHHFLALCEDHVPVSDSQIHI